MQNFNGIFIPQQEHASDLLKKFNMLNCKQAPIPVNGLKNEKDLQTIKLIFIDVPSSLLEFVCQFVDCEFNLFCFVDDSKSSKESYCTILYFQKENTCKVN